MIGAGEAARILDKKHAQIQAAIDREDPALTIVLAYEFHQQLRDVLYEALLRRIQEAEEK